LPLLRSCPVCKGDVWWLTCLTCSAEHYQCDTCEAEYLLRADGWWKVEVKGQLTRVADAPADIESYTAKGETVDGKPFAVRITKPENGT
jgi:hypothetical protein